MKNIKGFIIILSCVIIFVFGGLFFVVKTQNKVDEITSNRPLIFENKIFTTKDGGKIELGLQANCNTTKSQEEFNNILTPLITLEILQFNYKDFSKETSDSVFQKISNDLNKIGIQVVQVIHFPIITSNN